MTTKPQFRNCRSCGTTNRLQPSQPLPAVCGRCGCPLPQDSYYDLLGVSREASTSDIRRAYKRLVLTWHPDKQPENPVAVMVFQRIRDAYDTLSNPQKRLDYDRLLDTENFKRAENPVYQDSKQIPDEELWPQLTGYMAVLLVTVVGFVVGVVHSSSSETSLPWMMQIVGAVFVLGTIHFMYFLFTGKSLWRLKKEEMRR